MKKSASLIIIAILILFASLYFLLNFILYRSTFKYKYQEPINYKGLSKESIPISSGENIEIVFSKKNDNIVFIYFHGNAGRLNFITDFLKENYSFVSPAYAGYHGSSGKPSVENIYEVVQITKDFVRKNFAGKKIYVMGHSLGSQPAFYYGTIEEKTKVLAILEGFDSIYQMCKERMGYLDFICFVAKNSFNSSKLAYKNNFPFTFISFHSPEDSTVPFKRGLSLYNKVQAKNKIFFNFKQGEHGYFDVKLATDVIIKNDKN